ncbi:MAG: branched-chain amino acid ABC transporter permease [Dehalococcoidia bacterium]|nr:MAG: branched-chain amino acid ABC transporter permease [Dehalococcoidia bacterium]
MEDFLVGLAPPLIKGVLLGGLYVVIALGLSLVFGVMRLINVGHGDLVILGSYFAWAITGWLGIDPFLSLVMGVPLFFVLGFFVQKFIINRTFRISLDAALIACFGISIIVQSLCQAIWTPFNRTLLTDYRLMAFAVGPVTIPLRYLLDFIGGLAVMLALREFLRRTYLGKAISAASQNEPVAERMGINPNRVYSFAFAIAMACAAVAGVLLGLTFSFHPASGPPFLIISFGVIILGGLGSMAGTFIGGMIFGLSQTLGAYLSGSMMVQMLAPYVLVFVILSVRPQGIFGR